MNKSNIFTARSALHATACRYAAAGMLLSLIAAPAFAQTVAPTTMPANPATSAAVGTNVSQQQQIQSGLQSGALSTKEAATLENGQKRIDNVEAKDLKSGGTLSAAEQARINQMQTNQQNKITNLSTNAVTGNPASASSQNMQADVQKNVNQETRIQNGVNSGSLTNREAARLQKGQAKIDSKEAAAGANGHVNAAEQAGIQKADARTSGHIYRAKHNANGVVTPVAAPAATPAQ